MYQKKEKGLDLFQNKENIIFSCKIDVALNDGDEHPHIMYVQNGSTKPELRQYITARTREDLCKIFGKELPEIIARWQKPLELADNRHHRD